MSTWTHENGSCWLDWLPSDIPGIRIFVFGYEAQAVYFRSREINHNDSSRIFRFAETLCFDMNNSRFKVSDRSLAISPLITCSKKIQSHLWGTEWVE